MVRATALLVFVVLELELLLQPCQIKDAQANIAAVQQMFNVFFIVDSFILQ